MLNENEQEKVEAVHAAIARRKTAIAEMHAAEASLLEITDSISRTGSPEARHALAPVLLGLMMEVIEKRDESKN